MHWGQMMVYEQLRLHNQLCFPIYAAAHLFIRQYQPYLDELGITYPQYLVLLALWETDGQSVSEIGKKLILNTNTVTPLLKRMEAQRLLRRERSREDERKVNVFLTEQGKQMQHAAAKIPELFISSLLSDAASLQDLTRIRDTLTVVIDHLSQQDNGVSE